MGLAGAVFLVASCLAQPIVASRVPPRIQAINGIDGQVLLTTSWKS